jgi:hypothetical protein
MESQLRAIGGTVAHQGIEPGEATAEMEGDPDPA